MATSKKKSAEPVAIEMLEADHRKVEALFEQYESEKEGDESTKREIARKICGELTAHAQIEAASEVDATYDAKVKVLQEYIKHHVQEEEEEIFPTVADEKEELDALGQEMHARKAEIADELGLEPDAPPPGARGKGGKPAEQRR